MALDKNISREEFDRRLKATIERRRQERLVRETKHNETLALIAQYEATLTDIENHLHSEVETPFMNAGQFRSKLNLLADRSREVAAAL